MFTFKKKISIFNNSEKFLNINLFKPMQIWKWIESSDNFLNPNFISFWHFQNKFPKKCRFIKVDESIKIYANFSIFVKKIAIFCTYFKNPSKNANILFPGQPVSKLSITVAELNYPARKSVGKDCTHVALSRVSRIQYQRETIFFFSIDSQILIRLCKKAKQD